MIFDTSVVFAALDRSDAIHDRAAELFEIADDVLLPAPTLVELDWLSRSRKVPGTEAVLAGIVEGSLRPVELTLEDYRRVDELCRTYADLPLGLVDASVVAIAERYEEISIATLDHRHFSVVRPRHVTSFDLVP